MKVIIATGLPASGKSTWAKLRVVEGSQNGEKWKRVNKDELRAMLDVGQWSPQNEDFVLSVRDYIITQCLMTETNVIVDDVNLHPSHLSRIEALVKEFNPEAAVIFKSFWDVPIDVCILRDKARTNGVGQKVIEKFAAQYEEYKKKA